MVAVEDDGEDPAGALGIGDVDWFDGIATFGKCHEVGMAIVRV